MVTGIAPVTPTSPLFRTEGWRAFARHLCESEASPHKRRLKCDTNISPRRLITHLLHQMVHHRTTLCGNGQWSVIIARITTKTHTTTLTTKRSSESCAIRSFLRVTLSTGKVGCRATTYSMFSGKKSGSSSVKTTYKSGWVQKYSASPNPPT